MKNSHIASLILIMLSISPILSAQVFNFIEPTGTYYFSRITNSSNSFPVAYGIETIGQSGDNQVLTPYSSPQYYNTIDEDVFIANPNSSWIGDMITISDMVNTTITNQYNRTLYFKGLGSSNIWDMFTEEDGARIEASYTSIDQIEILEGINDAVATITLSVFDSLGNVWDDHEFHGLQLKVSGAYGVIELFPINQFIGLYEYGDYDSDSRIYKLTGLENGDEKFGWEYNFNPTVARVEVGTEVHYDYESYYSPYQKDDFTFEVKRKIMAKTFNDSLVIYHIRSCIHQFDSSFDSIYYMDYNESYQFDAKLNETLFSTNKNSWDGYLRIINCKSSGGFEGRPAVNYRIYNKTDEYIVDDKELWVLSPDYSYSMGTSAAHTFIDGLGDFIYYRGESHQEDRIVYYKTPTQEFGTPFDFDCPDASATNELFLNEVQIYPNPAEDRIEISCGESQIISVSIINIQGQKVAKRVFNGQTSNLRYDISNLEDGVYLVEIMTQNGHISQHKIIKK